MLKSYSNKKTYLTLVFLNQGWLPLLKITIINTLQLILVLTLSEKSENIADFLKRKEKLSHSPIYISHYILKKK